jgi:predicted N-acetyltransferase YhbS
MAAATNPPAPARGARIRSSVPEDADAIAQLINEAFVVERIAFDGDRTNPRDVRAQMHIGKFLLAEDSGGVVGCVYVELRGQRSYLGLLSVAPALQGKGLGRQLVAAAEDYSRSAECRAMDLRIISPRAEGLLPFYRRLGYSETGTAPSAAGVPVKVPCHYIVMSKPLT